MSLSNSNHQYKIYVSAHRDENQWESPLTTFKCNIKTSYIPDRPDQSVPSSISFDNSWHRFETKEPTREFISDTLADTRIIPFPLVNLHWKQRVTDEESIPLTSLDNAITSILGVVISELPNRRRRPLLVFIEKQVILPHHQYLLKLRMKQLLEHNHRSLARLFDSVTNLLDRISCSNEQQDVSRLSFKKDNCAVCFEEISTGTSQVTQMLPCSHVFHGHCIDTWLKESPTCPLCRLPTP